jgi:phosphate-selective porin OprO/OprP
MKKILYVLILLISASGLANARGLGVIGKPAVEKPQEVEIPDLVVKGRIHFDLKWFGGDDLYTKKADSISMNKARLSVTKNLGNGFSGVIEGNFAGAIDTWYLGDAYVAYQLPVGKIQLGNQKPGYSLAFEASSNTSVFNTNNRVQMLSLLSLPINSNIYLPGVAYVLYEKTYGAVLGVYGKNADEEIGEEDEKMSREPRRYTGRLYFAPVKDDNQTLHLGINLNHEKGGAKTDDDPYLLTDRNSVNRNLVGEFGYQYNSVSFVAEYINGLRKIPSASEGKRIKFIGRSAELVVALTGEKSDYVSGTFSAAKVNSPLSEGGSGAFYIGGRLSQAIEKDTADNDKKTKTTEGYASLNWAPESNVRIVFEYGKKSKKEDGKSKKGDTYLLQTRYFF